MLCEPSVSSYSSHKTTPVLSHPPFPHTFPFQNLALRVPDLIVGLYKLRAKTHVAAGGLCVSAVRDDRLFYVSVARVDINGH